MIAAPDLALAGAWGALSAAPLVLLGRRTGPRARVRALPVVVVRVPQPRRRRLVPSRVRALAASVAGRARRHRAAEGLGRELPLVLDLLRVALGAGATPYRAVELAVRWGPPAAAARLADAVVATRVGGTLADALQTVGREAPALAPVTDVLVASDRLGAPAGPALARLSEEVRADLRRRAEARARTLPVKLLFPLVFLVLPAFGLLTVAPALLTALART